MKAVLINPPSPYLQNAAAYPPSGLLYVATALEDLGHEVEIVDLAVGAWPKPAADYQADLFGITCVTPNVEVVWWLRYELHRYAPGVPVVVGGPHPTFLPEHALKYIEPDAIVTGEAELIMETLMDDLAGGRLKQRYDGGIVPSRLIPIPARHLVDLHQYSPGGQKSTPVYTSRGCPFNCAFCSKITGRTYRVVHPQQTYQELLQVKALGFEHVVFGDDDIAVREAHVWDICHTIKGLGLKFRLNQDARLVSQDLFRYAKECGCDTVSFGFESGSDRMLKLMNKQTTVAANLKAVNAARGAGLQVRGYLMVNFPGENQDTVGETIRFARQAKLDSWLLSQFAPLPGSDTYHNPAKYGIDWISDDWETFYLAGESPSFNCFTAPGLAPWEQRRNYFALRNAL